MLGIVINLKANTNSTEIVVHALKKQKMIVSMIILSKAACYDKLLYFLMLELTELSVFL
jgi:hypothetical protein